MLSESRKKANEKWKAKNKEKQRKYQYRSYAKSFVKNMADNDDLDELSALIDERRKQLKLNSN